MNVDANVAIFIVALLVLNLGSIVGSYINTKISIAELKTLVGILQNEVNRLRDEQHT